MAPITWLHISDLHFRSSQSYNANIVLEALLRDVGELVEEEGLRPDLIAVTGDIAFSGQEHEYEAAKLFFDDLLPATGLGKERLFLVPGNHDLNRSLVPFPAKAIAAALTGRGVGHEVLGDPASRRLVFAGLEGYAAFANSYLGDRLHFDEDSYFYVRQIDVADRSIALLGLNSAWLAIGDEVRGRLVLGERQVRDAVKRAEGADVKIALMHHPMDWLQEFDQNDCEPLLMRDCHFLLHGHLHQTSLRQMMTPDAGAMILAGGACYETRTHPNSYNVVRLDPETGWGTVYLRGYSDRQGGFWSKDTGLYRNVPDGEFVFQLPTPPERGRKVHAVPARPAAPAADPAKLEAAYLRKVQTTCNALPLAVIDPRAVERTRQQTMDLLAVYVDLDTGTPLHARQEALEGRRVAAQGAVPDLAQEETDHLLAIPAAEDETRPMTALEAVGRERQMVLLGDPGGGKSTFARYLALCLAGARLEEAGEEATLPGDDWLSHLEPAWSFGPLLPVQVTLRLLASGGRCDGTAAGLWRFIEDTLAAEGLGDFAPHLRRRLLDGGVLVICDGLDEVADPGDRKAVRDAVADFQTTYGHPDNRFLVTCRVYAYQDPCWHLDGFAAHTLAPFTQKQIDAFVDCWYQEMCRLGWKTEIEARELTGRLQAATHRPDLAPLAKSPLQLTMMASLHFSWGRLPDDRVELYQEMVRLLLVRWQEARLGEGAGVTQLVSAGDLESALERVAFVAHRAQEGPDGPADVSEVMLRSVLKDYLDGSWDRAGAVVAFISERAGLLLEREPGTYAFPHRSYQEYLAGSYLAVQPDFPDQASNLVYENYAQWREVALWAVGVMARLKRMTYVAVDVAAALCPREVAHGPLSEIQWRAAHLAGEALLEIGVAQVKGHERYKVVLARVGRWLAALLERGILPVRERAGAGDTLARLGDPRAGVGLGAEGMPDLAWCGIPSGPFLMGDQNEESQVPYDFAMSKVPVTNAQYRIFVEQGGYRRPEYWTEAGWAWREKENVEGPWSFGSDFDLDNRPVVGVSWYEAVAFCRWLTGEAANRGLVPGSLLATAEWTIRLPTEAEWEKAARGPMGGPVPGRAFPWGDEFDTEKANTREGRIGTTSAVGAFPGGASPYGLLDLSGNVFEWCQSLYRDDPYRAGDGREELEADGVRVLRGGSWFGREVSARCAFRDGLIPSGRYVIIGFRVVVSPALPASDS